MSMVARIIGLPIRRYAVSILDTDGVVTDLALLWHCGEHVTAN